MKKKKDGLRGKFENVNWGSTLDDKFHMSECSALPRSISPSTPRSELVSSAKDQEGQSV